MSLPTSKEEYKGAGMFCGIYYSPIIFNQAEYQILPKDNVESSSIEKSAPSSIRIHSAEDTPVEEVAPLTQRPTKIGRGSKKKELPKVNMINLNH